MKVIKVINSELEKLQLLFFLKNKMLLFINTNQINARGYIA